MLYVLSFMRDSLRCAGLNETATCLARHPVAQSLGPIDRLRSSRQFSVKQVTAYAPS
jgi:hypothetical protein